MNHAHSSHRWRQPAAAAATNEQGTSPAWDSSEAWAACAKALREYDEDMIQAWKEEIDTLLVFAGLFSAILTAFNIESYTLLQQQPEDATVAILSQISAQLNSFSANANFVNTTRPTEPSSLVPPFRASALAVRLNAMWFSALVCSLVSASLGLMVKQWLREYLAGSSNISRESIRIRQFRYQGLRDWYVPEIILFLPMLLQLALVLFFIGLLDLLWSLHPVVAAIVTVIIALTGLFALAACIFPPLFPDCPYKSPQSWLLCILVQSAKGAIGALASRYYYWHLQHSGSEADPLASKLDLSTIVHNKLTGAFRAWLHRASMSRPYTSWKEREKLSANGVSANLDNATLAGADATFMDDSFLHAVVRPCMNDIEPHAALRCLDRILIRRAPRVIYGLPYWDLPLSDAGDKTTVTLLHLLLDLLHRLNEDADDDVEDGPRIHLLTTMHRLVRAIPGQSTAMPSDPSTRALLRRTFDVLSEVVDREHERLTSKPIVRERAFHLMLKLFPRFHAVGPTCIMTLCAYSKKMQEDNSPYRFVQACCMVIRASAALAHPSRERLDSPTTVTESTTSKPTPYVIDGDQGISTDARWTPSTNGHAQPHIPPSATRLVDPTSVKEYATIRQSVLGVLHDLEDFFSIPVSRASECCPTMAMLAECAEATVALASQDRLAVSIGLVGALTDMISYVLAAGGAGGGPMSDAMYDAGGNAQEDHAITARQAVRLLRRIYGLGWHVCEK
ncbi:hypothetical protein GY45DRAFT_1315330 [Cubamyces sp. BRFM 1775]|nr:hypothetical protein GY45DRAFT_1315330 [Cubamyces sp. BRFM 1775]